MIWSATVPSFDRLLHARLALGAVTAAAGSFVASLVGDYFPAPTAAAYGFILAGELVGAGIGFAVIGDIAALSWRAALVILVLPAFVLTLAGCGHRSAAPAPNKPTETAMRREPPWMLVVNDWIDNRRIDGYYSCTAAQGAIEDWRYLPRGMYAYMRRACWAQLHPTWRAQRHAI